MVTLPDFFFSSTGFVVPEYSKQAGSLTPYAPVNLNTVSDGSAIRTVFSCLGE